MRYKEWEYSHTVLMEEFFDYWEEMWKMWPSRFPLDMSKKGWNLEYFKWLQRGRPEPVDKYEGILDETH